MQTPAPSSPTEIEKTAANGRQLELAAKHADQTAGHSWADAANELSHESVDAINERYKPAKGLRVRSSL